MDNRAVILENALELFSLQGYDAVGVQEICSRAGITKPTLYYYFGSKRGLLDAILNEKYAQLKSIIENAAVYKGDLPLTLYKVVSAYFSYASNNPIFYRLQMSILFSPPECESFKAVLPILESQLKILEELFINASKNHGNMKGRHKPYAVSLLGMVNTYIQMCFSGTIEINDEVTFKAVHQYMHGIYS